MVVALLACLFGELQGFAPSVQPLFGALKTGGLGGGRAVCPASAHRLGIFAKTRAGRAGGAFSLRAADEKSGTEAGTERREGSKQTAEVLKLSDRWVLQLDDQTGRPYYWNRKTSEVMRTFPSSASPWPTILKLASWFVGTNLSTLERKRALQKMVKQSRLRQSLPPHGFSTFIFPGTHLAVISPPPSMQNLPGQYTPTPGFIRTSIHHGYDSP